MFSLTTIEMFILQSKNTCKPYYHTLVISRSICVVISCKWVKSTKLHPTLTHRLCRVEVKATNIWSRLSRKKLRNKTIAKYESIWFYTIVYLFLCCFVICLLAFWVFLFVYFVVVLGAPQKKGCKWCIATGGYWSY